MSGGLAVAEAECHGFNSLAIYQNYCNYDYFYPILWVLSFLAFQQTCMVNEPMHALINLICRGDRHTIGLGRGWGRDMWVGEGYKERK